MSFINIIKASLCLYKGESELDSRNHRKALSEFQKAEHFFGDSIRKSHFFNLYLKKAECLYLLGKMDEGDDALSSARSRIEVSGNLSETEKLYLYAYAGKLQNAAHGTEGGANEQQPGAHVSGVRGSLLRDFPLENWS